MATTAPNAELQSFRREPSALSRRRRTPLQRAFHTELDEMQAHLACFSDIEAAIRLRAISELELSLSTDALCGLAASAH